MMQAGDRVGVAVSGGGDSIALLLLLEDLRAELGITLLVLHLNHQLRGADSDADEQFVAELARARGCELVSARRDVAAEARRLGGNVEDAARRLRYEFFAEVAKSGRATRVAVAHTADDQAETVLGRLLRGTGLAGLAGIYPVVGPVVRPLLDVRRSALRQYLAARGQSWREDASNFDVSRQRARIRHRLLPQLENDFQPAAVERLAELARLARADETFWSALVEDRFRALVIRESAGFAIRVPDLLAPLPLAPGDVPAGWPDALRRRIVRRIVEAVKAAAPPGASHHGQLTAHHVEQVLRLASEMPSGSSIHLPAGIAAQRSFDRLVFSLRDSSPAARETSGAAPAYEYVVELPARGSAAVDVPEIGKRYRLKVIDWPAAPRDTRDSASALDVDLLRRPLVLRNWRPGDAYRPQGSRSVRKLKRLFLDRRIAARERPGWPVLTSAGKVAWAGRLPAAEEFAARSSTRAGLLIDEETL